MTKSYRLSDETAYRADSPPQHDIAPALLAAAMTVLLGTALTRCRRWM